MFETIEKTEPRSSDAVGFFWILFTVLPLIVASAIVQKIGVEFEACQFLVTVIYAARVRWNYRNHWWFWATLGILLVLHAWFIVAVGLPRWIYSSHGKGIVLLIVPDMFLDIVLIELAAMVAGVGRTSKEQLTKG